MSHNFLHHSTFHSLLNKFDQEIANKIQKQGCYSCGGKLHQADYPRSPLGMPPQYRDNYDERLSFSCAICRKRTTPPSVRFFGRRWFPAPLLVLISALMLGINKRRCVQVKQHLGITVSATTWKRWRKWWRELFIATPFWQQAKGLVPIPLMSGPFPRMLFTAFQGNLEERMCALLRFLAPLTAGILRAV